MAGPGVLQGLRVLDFSQVAAGPMCTMLLGDMGAEVIKVEPPGGELGRQLGPPWLKGESVTFLCLNCNKKGVVIDLKQQAGVDVARRLARHCDVVVESFRPGVADRLGIGYAALREVNPKLIYCSISAYGQRGPWSRKPGVDGIVQAVSGLMSIIGTEDGPPCKVQTPAVDAVTSFLACMAVVGAVLARERFGIGQRIDVSLYNCALMLQQVSLSCFLASGEVPHRIGSAAPYAAPNEAVPTKDGWLMVAAYQQERWSALCGLLGLAHLASDPRFADNKSRVKHRQELVQILADAFRQRTTAEWVELLEAADIICAPIATYDQVVASQQAKYNQVFVQVDHPVAGMLRVPGFAIGFEITPGEVRLPPPMLGEHTVEVLRAHGLSSEEVEDLCRAGVVYQRGQQSSVD